MATKPLPDQATLLKLLRYEPETGKLFWRERPLSMFKGQTAMLGFNKRWAGREAFTSATPQGYKYAIMGPYGKIYAHRAIWCMLMGNWPTILDHADQDKANNRFENLSEVDRIQNGRNCRLSPRNRSGRIGVNWKSSRKMWRAKIRHGGRYIELGEFASFEDACAARADAEQKFGYSPLHGKRAGQ